MMKWSTRKLTKLMLSGIDLPRGSDTEISVDIQLIGAAANIRRTVNGDAINTARSVFRRYKIDISGSGAHPAGLFDLNPGTYVECVPHERMAMSLNQPSTAAFIRGASIDVVGLTADSDIIQPISQPPSPLPLASQGDWQRVAGLS